jgi:hypothetical protein
MDYDSEEGIRGYLTDLAGLHRLIRARADAGYQRKERMQEWFVLGRFRLDTCGNTMQSTLRGDASIDMAWLADGLPTVLPFDTLRAVLGKVRVESSCAPLPEPDSVCAECGLGWDLLDCHDSSGRRAANGTVEAFMHRYCERLAAERAALRSYQDIANMVGIGNPVVTPTPNEYCKDDAPWALMRTAHGTIKMGWRKRVLQIEWSDMIERVVKRCCRSDNAYEDYERKKTIRKALSAETLFPAEDVTKGADHIHAWSEVKAFEYLCVLHAAMKAARSAQ